LELQLAEKPNLKILNQINLKKEKKSLFTFMDLFCIKELIIGKSKRSFFKLATKIIDTKLSLEFQLNHFCDLEKIKLLLLNSEQLDSFNEFHKFKFTKHQNDIINFRNSN